MPIKNRPLVKLLIGMILLMLFHPIIQLPASPNINEIGVDIGSTHNFEVIGVEGIFTNSYFKGQNIALKVINLTLNSGNFIEVEINGMKFPNFLDQFGSFIVFTDWNYWDNFWEKEKFQSNENIKIEIEVTKSRFKIMSIEEQSFTIDENPDFESIIVTSEYTYDKEHGILIKSQITHDMLTHQNNVDRNDLIIENLEFLGRGDSILSVQRFLIILSLIMAVLLYVYPKWLKKKS